MQKTGDVKLIMTANKAIGDGLEIPGILIPRCLECHLQMYHAVGTSTKFCSIPCRSAFLLKKNRTPRKILLALENKGKTRSFGEVGKLLGISRQRVEQLVRPYKQACNSCGKKRFLPFKKLFCSKTCAIELAVRIAKKRKR